MADLIRERDWQATPLGPIADWPDALVHAVNLMLGCGFPSVVFWGPQLFQFYNDAYRPLLTNRHPAALGQTAREFWAEAWHIIGPQLESVLNEGRTILLENVLVPVLRNDAIAQIYWTYTNSPIYGAHGEVVAVLVVCQETTAAVLANQALQASEARASRILQSIGDAVIVTDKEGGVTAMNPVAEQLTGWGQAEAKGQPLARVFHIINEETRQIVESPADKVKRLGIIVGLANHTILVARDGRETYINDSGAPIRNDGGEMTGIVLVFRDIHDERLAEIERERLRAELDARYAELSAIYNNAAVALALIEPRTFTYLRANSKLGEMLDRPVEQIVGSSVFEHATDAEMLRKVLERVALGTAVTGQMLRGELASSPGVERYWQVDYLPVRTAEGRVERIAAASIEVTAMKKAEAALLQTEKLAAVGRLAASIAHEINNPLEAVTNLLYLARTSQDPALVQEYLDTAERELRRVSVISHQTLRFYRQSTNPTPITCEELLDSVLTMYQGRLINSRVEVVKRERATRPVLCFEGEIRQVLNNLIGNAIDAMHPGGGRLLLRSHERTDWATGRKGVGLAIADTGRGIDARAMAKIFDAFFTTKGIGGTGLGLWVSRDIVDRHHGALRARSAHHGAMRGTIFTLFLPFDAAKR